jgi:hypothetical protein
MRAIARFARLTHNVPVLTKVRSETAGKSPRYIEKYFQLFVVLAGFRSALLSTNLPIGSDGLSYLELARSYLRHDWPTVVNGYWGPLYALLVAGWLKLFHPSAGQEFGALRALNFLVFLFCFYSFVRFWRSLAQWNRMESASLPPPTDVFPVQWMLLGYTLFVVHTLWFIDIVGPDILAGSLVLLISARLLELHGRKTTWIDYVGLGLLLAAGFYTKAILFFFGLAVLGSLLIASLLSPGSGSRPYRRPLAAALVFALVLTPYVIALSRTLGHLSFGETGRLNYAWLVDGTETGPWAEGGASFPFFPGPVALQAPRVFAVPRLAGITYAPWFDPARFDKHSHASFNLRGQLRQIATSLKSLDNEILGTHSALLVCLMVLASAAPALFLRRLAASWFCIVPSLVVVGMYLLVFLVGRYLIGFSLVLWGILFSCVRVPANSEVLMRRSFACGLAVFAAFTLPGMAHFLVSRPPNLIQRDLIVAAALPNYGIQPGDAVGIIGDGQVAYWAHWAKVAIVAEVASMDSAYFWSSSPASQQTAVRSMAALGAKAVVWRRDSAHPCPQDWIPLPANAGCLFASR